MTKKKRTPKPTATAKATQRNPKQAVTAKPSQPKARYRVRNWRDYNQSLVQRGSVTVWISQDVLDHWHPQPDPDERRSRGGQVQYSDHAIECLLMLRAVFRLPYRQTQGLGQSLLTLLGATVSVPDYTTLCKRSADLGVRLPIRRGEDREPVKHIVLDSTGLKVYGEGEWKVRQHGYSQRRTWRKLHLSVDEATHEIQAVVLTEAGVHDADAADPLLAATPGDIEQVSADGTYDKRKVYAACAARQVRRIAIPPHRNARIWQHGNCADPPLPRDQNLRLIRRVGRKRWKQAVGYHRRSLVETAMFRFKLIFGNRLRARTMARQITEARIQCAVLNRMTHLGMPDSYRVGA